MLNSRAAAGGSPWYYRLSIGIILLQFSSAALAGDTREMVELPDMMQGHMLANMRDHLQAIDEILGALSEGELEKAADTAENRLGMSSLATHGAEHMAPFMPKGMRELGTGMHKAASRFALRAQEGDPGSAYRALKDVTASCVACHALYRIR